MATKTAPTLADVEAARERLAGKGVRVTPVYPSETFTRRLGRPVLLKAENLQRTGSFKVRGAVNKLESLSEAERKAGVVTASAARTARSGSSSCDDGAPKIAIAASPMNFSTVPP